MKTNNSTYAQYAYLEIQNLSSDLQNHIDNFYLNTSHDRLSGRDHTMITNKFSIDLKNRVISNIESLNDVLINYIKYIRKYYYDMDEHQNLYVSTKFEEFIDNNLDIINANFNNIQVSNITNDIIIKYINLKLIYNNIISDADKLCKYKDDLDSWQVYSSENILMILDVIMSEFYECTENIKKLSLDETSILGIFKNYIFELRAITYIIEFIESIRLI